MFNPDEREALRQMFLARDEVFLGPVDHDHAKQVMFDLMKVASGRDQVQLVIASPGGATNAGFLLAMFIEQELGVPVHARVWGECSSAATYPLLCCTQRVAHPDSIFVLHRHTSEIDFEFNREYYRMRKEARRSDEKMHKRQVDFYTRKLKLTRKEVEKELLRGTGIDAEITVKKALRIGLITEIKEFPTAT